MGLYSGVRVGSMLEKRVSIPDQDTHYLWKCNSRLAITQVATLVTCADKDPHNQRQWGKSETLSDKQKSQMASTSKILIW